MSGLKDQFRFIDLLLNSLCTRIFSTNWQHLLGARKMGFKGRGLDLVLLWLHRESMLIGLLTLTLGSATPSPTASQLWTWLISHFFPTNSKDALHLCSIIAIAKRDRFEFVLFSLAFSPSWFNFVCSPIRQYPRPTLLRWFQDQPSKFLNRSLECDLLT